MPSKLRAFTELLALTVFVSTLIACTQPVSKITLRSTEISESPRELSGIVGDDALIKFGLGSADKDILSRYIVGLYSNTGESIASEFGPSGGVMRDFRVPHQAEVRAEVAFDFAPSSELPMIFRTYSFVARRPGTVRLVQAYTKTHEVFIDFPKEPIKGDYIIAKLRYHHNEVTYYKAVNIINDSNNNPTINDRHIDWLSEAVDSDFRFDLIGRFRGQKIDDFSVNSVVELDRILYLKLQRSTTGSRYFFETINRIR